MLATWPGFDPARLASIPVPVLVVQGDRDQMVPLEQGQELARLAPQAASTWCRGRDIPSCSTGMTRGPR